MRRRKAVTLIAFGQELSGALYLALAFSALIAGTIFIQGCSEPEAAFGEFSLPPMPVEIVEVKVEKVADQFEAIGTIEALESVVLVSEINAIIVSLPFEEGGVINAGELIARLDDKQLAAEVARAEALRAQSQATYNRVKAIVEQNAAAPQDLDDAAAALNVAEANLALARARFSKTRITAPFDGTVGARRVSVGSYLGVGEPIAQLANLDNIRVSFSASEGFLTQLNRGDQVTVSTPVYPDNTVSGRIIAIEPVLDPVTRNGRVVARVSNPGRRFVPGMSVNVSAVLDNRLNAITVPNEAVFATGNQSFVFTVKPDSTVVQVPVTLGSQMADAVEIVQGLESGSRVVRAGHQKIFHGAKVMPVSTQNGAAQ
ncbi:MAG: efflux RND transporter periplasmic adaptor subunit [Ignavibacteriales bacterium]|nr:efflux RND transporter periplasmic adaptor subunit [Ignavibacteriales bacterium]